MTVKSTLFETCEVDMYNPCYCCFLNNVNKIIEKTRLTWQEICWSYHQLIFMYLTYLSEILLSPMLLKYVIDNYRIIHFFSITAIYNCRNAQLIFPILFHFFNNRHKFLFFSHGFYPTCSEYMFLNGTANYQASYKYLVWCNHKYLEFLHQNLFWYWHTFLWIFYTISYV